MPVEAVIRDICRCPVCGGLLESDADVLVCAAEGVRYPVVAGIPVLLAPERDPLRLRFRDSYAKIATSDLTSSLERTEIRQARHASLLTFIGDVRGKRILDIGSSDGAVLRQVNDAALRVALDIAIPYLEAMPRSKDFIAVAGDAESLPFRRGAFDLILVTDVLEHVLNPDAVMKGIRAIATPRTRIIVEVPWEEDLSSYRESEFEFTHLRSFDMASFVELCDGFVIRRRRAGTPRMEVPVLLTTGRLPNFVAGTLAGLYRHNEILRQVDYDWRQRRLRRLPEYEAALLWLFPPLLKKFELKLYHGSREERLIGAVQWLRRFHTRGLRLLGRDRLRPDSGKEGRAAT